jgi:hypothetical protein
MPAGRVGQAWPWRGGLVALVLLAVLTPGSASAQCAMCRTLLKTPEGQHMVAAFRSGILLLAAPFSILRCRGGPRGARPSPAIHDG